MRIHNDAHRERPLSVAAMFSTPRTGFNLLTAVHLTSDSQVYFISNSNTQIRLGTSANITKRY